MSDRRQDPGRPKPAPGPAAGPAPGPAADPAHVAAQADMLGNRLRKRVRHLRKWARREGVHCYRVYDRDIPEIPLAIDWYQGRLHLARYRRNLDPGPGWIEAMAGAAGAALEVPRERIYIKERARQRGTAQYERVDRQGERFTVDEDGHRFLVDLGDYLDTGLFLDHRLTRARVAGEARGTRFLNLFCYTGSFTVYAAAAGARETVSVDMSRTYLDWAHDNMVENRLAGPAHRFVRADVDVYLDQARPGFDLAVLDPPTFSNSKKMQGVLDIQRDHVALINRTLGLLRPGGVLYFSTNHRRFKLDEARIRARDLADITRETIPEDFTDARIHQCWRLVR